jgi:hypothetical protein
MGRARAAGAARRRMHISAPPAARPFGDRWRAFGDRWPGAGRRSCATRSGPSPTVIMQQRLLLLQHQQLAVLPRVSTSAVRVVAGGARRGQLSGLAVLAGQCEGPRRVPVARLQGSVCARRGGFTGCTGPAMKLLCAETKEGVRHRRDKDNCDSDEWHIQSVATAVYLCEGRSPGLPWAGPGDLTTHHATDCTSCLDSDPYATRAATGRGTQLGSTGRQPAAGAT